MSHTRLSSNKFLLITLSLTILLIPLIFQNTLSSLTDTAKTTTSSIEAYKSWNVQNLQATKSGNKVTLTWTTPEMIERRQPLHAYVYKDSGMKGNPFDSSTVGPTGTIATFPGLPRGTYYFKVVNSNLPIAIQDVHFSHVSITI